MNLSIVAVSALLLAASAAIGGPDLTPHLGGRVGAAAVAAEREACPAGQRTRQGEAPVRRTGGCAGPA